MKNLINRKYQSVLATFALAAILVPMSFAGATTNNNSGAFNTDSADYQTLLVSNYTLNPGSSSNWSSSVSATAGQIVSFQIYYHNSSNQTANNTKISLNLPSGQFTNSSASATISADSTQSVQGSASINLSSSQTLTLIPGSLQWYPNQSDSTQSLPSGQSGDQIVSSGINIGNIAPGWESQGYVVVRAQVSTTQTPQGQAPTVSTNSASGIYQTSATLNGTVNPNNSNTDAWFEYGTNSSLGTTVGSQSVGSGNSSINKTYYLSGLQQNTTYYFRVVARNQNGTSYGGILNFNTQVESSYQTMPTVSTNSASSIDSSSAVLNGLVNPNGSSANAWFEYGITQSLGYTTGYQNVGSANYSRNYSSPVPDLSSNTTYYYRAAASNGSGTSYGSILIFSTNSSGQVYSSQVYSSFQPSVTTQAASPVYQNSALVNGSVNPNSGLTTAWFQWGTNTNLGNITVSQPVGSGNIFTNFSAALTGLSQNTTYYYRLVASNNSGTVYGNTLSFTTQAVTPSVVYQTTQPQVIYQSVQPQVIYVPTTIKAATSSLVLLISNADQETAIAGDALHYVVVYKNLSQQKLTNVVLKIIFPLEVDYISSNPKAISLEGNSITYQVGNLDPGEEGSMDVEFMVKNSVRNNDSLIFSATLEYQDAKNAFHSDNTFLSVLATNRPSLMANLLSIGGFSGIFWGLILGLIIGFMIYWLGFRKRFVKVY